MFFGGGDNSGWWYFSLSPTNPVLWLCVVLGVPAIWLLYGLLQEYGDAVREWRRHVEQIRNSKYRMSELAETRAVHRWMEIERAFERCGTFLPLDDRRILRDEYLDYYTANATRGISLKLYAVQLPWRRRFENRKYVLAELFSYRRSQHEQLQQTRAYLLERGVAEYHIDTPFRNTMAYHPPLRAPDIKGAP